MTVYWICFTLSQFFLDPVTATSTSKCFEWLLNYLASLFLFSNSKFQLYQKLSRRTEDLQNGAEDFASMANELVKTLEARKWWHI